jgi:hypothetical protein
MWLDSAQENLKAVGIRNWRQVTRLRPMATNRKRGQSSLWTVTPAEEEAIWLHNFVAIWDVSWFNSVIADKLLV